MSGFAELVEGSLPQPELSFSAGDVERRLGFPAGRFTAAGPVLAPVLGLVLTLAFYGLLALAPTGALARMFCERGVVPYAIVFLTAWSAMLLLVKTRKLALQRQALRLRLLPPEDPSFVLTPATAPAVLEQLYTYVDDPQHFLLTRRIQYALSNLQNVGRIADVGEVLRTQSENDEAQVEGSYTLLQGFIWAIPVLGFIGTVLGLSLALGSFGGVLESADQMEQLRAALQEVTGGLATAFETTLEGLVAALGVHMTMIAVKGREERFLDDCQDYCQKYVVGRLRLTQPPSAP